MKKNKGRIKEKIIEKIDDRNDFSQLFDSNNSVGDDCTISYGDGNSQKDNFQDLPPTEYHPYELVANINVQYDFINSQSNGMGDGGQSNNNHNITQDFEDSIEKQSFDLESPNNNLLDPKNNPKDLLLDSHFKNQIDQVLGCTSSENGRNNADFSENSILSENLNGIIEYDNINKEKNSIFHINSIPESVGNEDIKNNSKLLNKKRKRKNYAQQLKKSHDNIRDFNSSNKKQNFILESPKSNINMIITINHSFLDDDSNNQNLNTLREEESERNDIESVGNTANHNEINKKENINKKDANNIVIIPYNKYYYYAHEKDYIIKNKTTDFKTMSIREISQKYEKFSILKDIFKEGDLTYIENHGIIYKYIDTKLKGKNKEKNKGKKNKKDKKDKVKIPPRKFKPIKLFGKLKTFINQSNIEAINKYGLDDKIKTIECKEEKIASLTKGFILAYLEQPLYNIL